MIAPPETAPVLDAEAPEWQPLWRALAELLWDFYQASLSEETAPTSAGAQPICAHEEGRPV